MSLALAVLGAPGGPGAGERTTNATVGGIPISQLTATTSVSGDVGGRMFVMSGCPIMVSGTLSAIKLSVGASTTSCRVSIWRSGTRIWQSSLQSISASAVNTIPVQVDVQSGDLIGVWLPASGIANCIAFTSCNVLFAADTTAALTSTSGMSSLPDVAIFVEAIAVKPMIGIVGDSIAAGTNTATGFVGPFSGATKGGNLLAQPGYIAAQNKNWGYRNYALGSTTFAWVAATGFPAAVASGATHIWIHCGVNDVSTTRTWAAVEADLNTIKASKPSGVKLFIDEILPWTTGTDPQASTIRTWNANLAVWCAANGATLIRCHDTMGQTRGSTGQLDDLKTAYNQDGVHVNQAGVYKLAYCFAPIAPAFSSTPSISGVAGVDVTVFVTPGTALNEPTYTYQWYADGVAISGATSSSYTITSAELGKYLTVKQTATNSAGSASLTSSSIGPATTYPTTVDFDGVNDDATGVPVSNAFLGDFAVNVNIDADAFSGYLATVNNTQALFAFIGTGGDIAFGNSSGWGEWTKANGEWRFVHDTSKVGFARLRAFKDGVEQTPARTTGSYVQFAPSHGRIIFGSRPSSSYYNGRLSRCKVWSRACLPSDSDQTTNLVLSLGPVSGTTWYDTSGNGTNYILNNGAVGV